MGHAQVPNTQPLNHNRSSQSKGRAGNGKLVIFCGDPPQRKDTTDKKHTRNFEKELPEWNNKLEGVFLFLFLTLAANCCCRQESHKILFLAVCFPNDRKFLTLRTRTSHSGAKGLCLLMKKQQRENSLCPAQEDQTPWIIMH